MSAVTVRVHSDRDGNGWTPMTWTADELPRILDLMGIGSHTPPELFAETIPFALNDTTAGAENELQAVVIGDRDKIDFPLTIEHSNFFQNLGKRTEAGDTSRRLLDGLQAYLDDNPDRVWENSWVRFPRARLSRFADAVFSRDLLADKSVACGPERSDSCKFTPVFRGEAQVRVPVSYLLKLALADTVGASPEVHPTVKTTGERLMGHFLNDNSSPEIFSFYPVPVTRSFGMGKGIARETLKRFLLSQLLIQYANRRFGLIDSGQRAVIYFAPHTHVRQKRLNDLISDAFYRELFMSPCLCGWDRGEEKHRYMGLCHQVLSRSQLHAVSQLREAGIITRNLVVMPSLSNLSLANNGTHISLGSRKLTALMADSGSGFGFREEKYMGDLAIKIIEHFLPLFVGTYSAAPYRLDFCDFHPEKALGFLPHELDFTHLRMIWRRWKKKAKLKVFGRPVTPFGPQALDQWFSRVLGLKGDFVHDFRLLDYFVAVKSTDRSPALDGTPENQTRLKRDLADFGVFDAAMPVYLLYRLREFAAIGFSGFEGRYYSQFENIMTDMGAAAGFQNLITALAYKYILGGRVTHGDIPDDPTLESERRQVFFGTAIGIPTFYVHQKTRNRFLHRIINRTRRTRMSRRYSGYIRVYNEEYRRALLSVIREDGPDLIEMMGAEETLRDLTHRIEDPKGCSAAGRLTAGILENAGSTHPMKLNGEEFGLASERFYRSILRKRHIQAALDLLEIDFKNLDAYAILGRDIFRDSLAHILGRGNAGSFLDRVRPQAAEERIDEADLVRLIHLILLSIHQDVRKAEQSEFA